MVRPRALYGMQSHALDVTLRATHCTPSNNASSHKLPALRATFWHRDSGDVTAFGKSDLVLIARQRPHETFERLGDDLWFYHPVAIHAEQLYFCARVPTLSGRTAVAQGNTLAAVLGYDRSNATL